MPLRRDTPSRSRVSLRLLLSGAPLLLVSSVALALDPSVGVRLEQNVAPGPAATERLTPEGTNQTSVLLPSAPRVAWQTRLAPPIVGELASDARGNVLVAHSNDRVTSVGADGRVLWSVRVGAEVVSGPVPLAGGRCLVVTRDARLLRLSPNGNVEERSSLPATEVERPVLVSPTRDGGALVAAGASLVRTGPPGTEGFQTALPDPLRAVFEWQARTLAVGRSGTVFSRPPAGDPQKLGSFGQPVRAVARAGDHLFAIGKHEFVSLDLPARERRILFSDPALELKDFAALGAGKWRLLAGRALLVDVDPSGRELARHAVAGNDASLELGALVSDRSGRTWLTVPGAPLLDVTPQGDVTSLTGTGCPDPLRPTPVSDGIAIAACRSGLLRALSDKGR
jgi:hypothetical protein